MLVLGDVREPDVPFSQSTAMPKPIPPAMFAVPASNFHGRSLYVVFSNVTDEIMSPPPWYGGSFSSHSSVP